MPDLYPLLLRPEFHERVWGSHDLAPLYTEPVAGGPIGEVWLTGASCRVVNGPFAERTLAEVTGEFAAGLLGDVSGKDARFPLLIKFLFPKEKLSVQVHPDDDDAVRMGQVCGKTECWYVLKADAGAQIGLGLKAGTRKSEIEQAIRETRMERLLNWIHVRPGDMFYVDAGTVHAIGPGSVIVETQQYSDTTFRLYDYGRPRELHLEDGLRATKERTHAGKTIPGREQKHDGRIQTNLLTSPFFIVDKFQLTKPWRFERPAHARRSVWCLVALRGCGVIENEGEVPIAFAAGEVVIIPATLDGFILKPQWEVELLCSSLPVEKASHPLTFATDSSVAQAGPGSSGSAT